MREVRSDTRLREGLPLPAGDGALGGLLRAADEAGDTGVVRDPAKPIGESRRLGVDEEQVVDPDVAYHIELGPGTAFVVEFYR